MIVIVTKPQLPLSASLVCARPHARTSGPRGDGLISLPLSLGDRYHYSHFTEAETEAQKGRERWESSLSCKGQSQGPDWQPLSR